MRLLLKSSGGVSIELSLFHGHLILQWLKKDEVKKYFAGSGENVIPFQLPYIWDKTEKVRITP